MPDLDLYNIRFEALLNNMLEGVLVEDESRKIILTNQKFCDYFQADKTPSDFLGLDCGKMAEDFKSFFKNPENFTSRISEVLKNKLVVIGDEIETLDGKFYSRNFIPVVQDNGYYGNLWTYRDITYEKKSLLDLQSSEKELKEINSYKDKLFTIIAHDLRGPLASLKGIVDLINEGDIDAENTKDIFSALGKQLNSTFQLLNNLLFWSSNQIKKREVKIESFKLFQKINDILLSIEPFSTGKNIKINLNIPENFEINFDPEILTIVLRNLIINAIKYTLKNGTVFIYLENLDNGYNLHIKDTGIGMDEIEVSKLFLYESVNSRLGTNKEKGTGIGLLLCKELVELCNGSITVKSKISKGSDFILFIPN